jgi:hypothetical protein
MAKIIDVFPAVIRLAPADSLSDITELNIIGDVPPQTRTLDRCRIVAINGTLIIGVDSPEGVNLVFREKFTEMVEINKTFYCRTESGKILAFRKDNNCGCGSRLRGWNPYGSIITAGND